MSVAARPRASGGTTVAGRGLRARIVIPPPTGGHGREGEAPCIVHLVRAANGPAPVRAFAAALRRHRAGVDHRLVLAMKGFGSPQEARPLIDELADLEPRALFFPDTGLDLGVYLAAAARLRRRRYCFLNSYSVPLVDGWLAKLDAALDRPGAGVVGATGAWTSNRSWLAYSLGLPSAYRGLLPPASDVRERMLALMSVQPSGTRSARLETLRARALALRLLAGQERFPAYSLRTNAFMISHATLQRLRLRPIGGRTDSLALESGRDSITRQLHRRGLRTLVVDRAGEAFDHTQWDRSLTFWQGDQEGLLVADNRTLLYERADLRARRVLASLTWGSHARPGPPAGAPRPLELGPHAR
jgi:hypothetical protein